MKKVNHLKLTLNQQTWGDIPEWTYSALGSLMESLRVSDNLTYHHCVRVGESCRKLARAMGLGEFEQKVAHISGMLHDIGKIGIDRGILHKPSRLTDSEYRSMCEHPLMSEQIILPLSLNNPFLHATLSAVRGHHERLDGTGYPDKLAGDQVPLTARIVLVTDTFDAMSFNRPYRLGLPAEVVYAELKEYSGTQFDAQIAKIFIEAHSKWNFEKDQDLEINEKIFKRST